MPTDTSERGLERIICAVLAGHPCDPSSAGGVDVHPPSGDGVGWVGGNFGDYDREFCVDLVKLSAFLRETQPRVAGALALDEDCPTRRKFLTRLRNEIDKNGTIKVLRDGIKHGAHSIDLYYVTPSVGNQKAVELHAANRFSVTRQLHYSRGETQRSLDMALFINGLPVVTLELKNSLTRQTVADAVWQYKTDRDPREKLFHFGRCIVHFAVDDNEVRFCTRLAGKESLFLPFNLGWNDGAGNPPNPDGIKTDYLWKRVLARDSLTNIIENYAQMIEEKNEKTGRKKEIQIWPRYHQLDVVRKLLADVASVGAGKRYLIQHSAGSGKSNSIAWLTRQLVGLMKDNKHIFDSIIVVTDRRLLDQQISNTIKQYLQVGATMGHANRSGDLRKFIDEGKKIIISTVQKFPFILDEIHGGRRGQHYAIIIDEAHSSQGGKTGAAMGRALQEDGEETFEDKINYLMESRKLLSNASYFAFTATPKNKTLELFGAAEPQPDDTIKHRSFHKYTMKQAIQEGFILDVLRNYTPVKSYYRLIKTIEEDPTFGSKRASKKLRRYVESHDHAMNLKAEIIVDHFHAQVIARGKIGGLARAMVVTDGVNRAIQYFHAISKYLRERKSPHRAIVAFSGEHEFNGQNVREASLNGFSANLIAEKIRENPYRFLICADKFQTGYDEPLLHTMYVDKHLSNIKAVQTLSRLNRAHPKKSDVFVLDFTNDSETISDAFADYYRETILSDETDPNKLHNIQSDLAGHQVYSPAQIDELVRLCLNKAKRDQMDIILDICVPIYMEQLDENRQVEFKSKAKMFMRTYDFLSQILPYTNQEWEKLSIFLNFLVPKLPAPHEDDLSRGILEVVDMDSYRAEKQAVMNLLLLDEDAEIEPVPTGGGGRINEDEPDLLSNILQAFNDQFGNIDWHDIDQIRKQITEYLPAQVKKDAAYNNARQNSDRQNARIEFERALGRAMSYALDDNAELFKQYSDNKSFRRWLSNSVFNLTYEQGAANQWVD